MNDLNKGSRSSNWQGSWALLRDIEVVCAVIAERKTTGAALRLGISQPAISRAIAKIEAKTGRKLFHRESGRLIPTAEALALYKNSTRIFEAINELETGSPENEKQSLRIVSPPTIGNVFLEREAAIFASQNRDIFVSFDIVALQDIPSTIAGRTADVSLIDSNILHSGVVLETFIETNAVCILPKNHVLADKETINIEDLNNIDYVAIKRRHSLRHALDHLFLENRISPNFTIETDSSLTAIEFIRQGMGISILNPFPVMLDKPEGVISRSISVRIPFKINFVISAGSELPASARKFVDFVKSRKLEAADYMTKHS